MWVLGLAASHNGAVALIEDGVVRVAVQLERLERAKRFPVRWVGGELGPGVARAVNYCLRAAGIDSEAIGAVAATTPWALPDAAGWPGHRIEWVPHHLAHAEYALHWSEQKRGLVLVVDGHGTQEADRSRLDLVERIATGASVFGGETETVSAYHFDGGELELIYRTSGSHDADSGFLSSSIGQLWELTSSIVFGRRDQAGKVMGLAAYGERGLERELFGFDADGRLTTKPKLLCARVPYRYLARAVQEATTQALLQLLERLRPAAPGGALYYSGGVALNVVSNEHIVRSGTFDSVEMNGSCEDNGTAIGAALAVYHARTGRRVPETTREFLGAPYHRYAIQAELERFPVSYERLATDDLVDASARGLGEGKVIAWFQGESEFGPRALGNRSILGDPRSPTLKDRLNGRVKHRESFRPYGACVRADRAAQHFEFTGFSPVMLREGPVKDPELPAVTHADGSCRLQTVAEADNLRLFQLLTRFGELTGKPVLLNTSLNVAGEPIVETPREAIETLLRTEIDALAIGDFLVKKV